MTSHVFMMADCSFHVHFCASLQTIDKTLSKKLAKSDEKMYIKVDCTYIQRENILHTYREYRYVYIYVTVIFTALSFQVF